MWYTPGTMKNLAGLALVLALGGCRTQFGVDVTPSLFYGVQDFAGETGSTLGGSLSFSPSPEPRRERYGPEVARTSRDFPDARSVAPAAPEAKPPPYPAPEGYTWVPTGADITHATDCPACSEAPEPDGDRVQPPPGDVGEETVIKGGWGEVRISGKQITGLLSFLGIAGGGAFWVRRRRRNGVASGTE